MGQVFHPATNTIAKATVFGAIFFLAGLAWAVGAFVRSSYWTQAGVPREQPIPFSHKHHVQGLGVDCRYCHTSAETSSSAGIPSTETCMGCHAVVWKDAAVLEPLRESHRTGKPIEWTRVHDLPDFVYFDHSIHINKGVGCTSCHGQVDQMPLTWRENSLQMEWCLECHRAPEKHLRPREEVFNPHWTPPADQESLQARLAEEYNVQSVLNCTACHR